jgi:uncharacterized protein YehS (DUF1456 family)
MNKNDILRRVRYALNISNLEMVGIFKLAGHDILERDILNILKKEEEDGYVECSDRELELFLDGLIILKRGKKETSAIRQAQGPDGKEELNPDDSVKQGIRMSNNLVLKKLRIALNFKEEDMLEMFRLSEFEIAKSELSAFFRKKGHKNYKVCGDQILKHFIKGLTVFYRK